MTQTPEREPRDPVDVIEPLEMGESGTLMRGVDRVVFVDARSVTWQVSERDGRDCPGARGPRCLLFDSGDVVRRVWSYPEAWRSLSAAALTALSWRR